MPRPASTLFLQSVVVAGGIALGFLHAFGDAVDLRGTAVGDPLNEPVTRRELSEAIAAAASGLRGEMREAFDAQDQAIASLTEMTEHTGQLIERLLDRMEAGEAATSPRFVGRTV